MNTFLYLILPVLNLAFVALVVTGRVRITWFPEEEPQQSLVVAEVVAPSFQKGKRGRPRKTKTHYLHMSPRFTKSQLGEATGFFVDYEDRKGDKVVLIYKNADGAEESAEIPYSVKWDDQVKDRFSREIAGWA